MSATDLYKCRPCTTTVGPMKERKRTTFLRVRSFFILTCDLRFR